MAKQTENKIIKETSYYKIYNKVSIEDDDYYSCIERIEAKEKQRHEIRLKLKNESVNIKSSI